MKKFAKSLFIKLWTAIQLNFLYRFRSAGHGIRLGRRLFVFPNKVTIGNRVFVGSGSFLDGDIVMGNDIMLASNVAIVGGDHIFRVPGAEMFAAPREHWRATTINDNVWIGHGAIILNGVTIGTGAIVAAGSLVTKDVEPFTIVSGNPAQKLRDRFTPDELDEHIRIRGLTFAKAVQ